MADNSILLKRAKEGDISARNKIVEENMGLVWSVVKHFSGRGDSEDLAQIGAIGLIKAASNFNTDFNVKFSTYAVPMITGEIKSQLRDQGKIKVSRSLKREINIIKKAEEEYILKNGKSPRISELAEKTNLSNEQVALALQARDALNNMENYEDAGLYTIEEELCITKMDLANTLRKLDKREQQVMTLRYYKDMTQQQVADLLGLSQVQISRIEKKSLKTMAEFMSI